MTTQRNVYGGAICGVCGEWWPFHSEVDCPHKEKRVSTLEKVLEQYESLVLSMKELEPGHSPCIDEMAEEFRKTIAVYIHNRDLPEEDSD